MRSRNIKPGFFKNEILAEIEPLGRLLFQGLWCMADREGRLEDRPRKIKAEVLPYDNCDIDALLNVLAEKNFIIRYEVNGNRYIQVTKFKRHQNPHKKEAASEIPAPPVSEPEVKEEVQEIPERASEIPERAGLIPDSCLIPDSRTRRTDSLNGTRTGVRTHPGGEARQKTDGNGRGNGFKEIVNAFSNNIHPITPMEADGLGKWIDEGLEPGLIIWAIRQAVIQGKRTARYIDAILCNLHAEGITTLASAEARERDREQRKREQPAGSRPREPAPVKLTPEEKARIAELNRQIAELTARKEIPP